jgi:hypothetical protein
VAGGLELAHFTVKEYLLTIDSTKTPQFMPFLLNPKNNLDLGIVCLTYLNSNSLAEIQPTELEISDVVEKHPFLPYAVPGWDYHALESMQDGTVSRLTHALSNLDVCKQFQLYRLVRYLRSWDSLLQTADLDDDELGMVINCSRFQDTTPLHWAAYLGLESLCAWLID